MGCIHSKDASAEDDGIAKASIIPATEVALLNGSSVPHQTAEPAAADTSTVELEDMQEARDSVGSLPSALDISASEQQQRPGSRGVQFGSADVQTFEVPPLPSEEHSHLLLQKSLPQVPASNVELETRAAGLKHIGFGPLKKENQDEYFCQVGGFGGLKDGCCYCIFDGHGNYGRDAAQFCRQELPVLFDQELRKYFSKATADNVKDPNAKELIEPIISDAFVETERRLHQAGINVSSSGTTASVVFQIRSSVWVAAAGDSRVLCMAHVDNQWKVQPLTLDHRPSRKTEKYRVEAAGGRVEPKRLPSGKTVGEPRLWLANLPSPGLLLSRSIGDDMATSVGCTARPEITFMGLRPFLDQYLVIASDGVWDVLSNDRVAQLVGDAADPEAACQAVLEAALLEWEERLAADNISIIVVQLVWGDMLASNGSNAVFRLGGGSFQSQQGRRMLSATSSGLPNAPSGEPVNEDGSRTPTSSTGRFSPMPTAVPGGQTPTLGHGGSPTPAVGAVAPTAP